MERAVLVVAGADYTHIEQRLRALGLLDGVELVAIAAPPEPSLVDRLKLDLLSISRPEPTPDQPYYRRFERKRRPR